MITGIIDSHCHLNHENNASVDKPGDILARAHVAGVGGCLTICCQIAAEFDPILAIARDHDNVWCTIGTHPHESEIAAERAVTIDDIVARSHDPKVIGIGETGLDFYYDHSDRAVQEESFRKHIRAAALAGLPLIIHARDADQDIMRVLQDEGAGRDPRIRGVMHCFSSTQWLAEAALEIGFYISFSGILTFKKAVDLREIAKMVPVDRMLVETDAPFLAPEPLRGQVNEPAFILHTVRVLADLKKMDERGAIEHCNQNFFRLFNKAQVGA